MEHEDRFFQSQGLLLDNIDVFLEAILRLKGVLLLRAFDTPHGVFRNSRFSFVPHITHNVD